MYIFLSVPITRIALCENDLQRHDNDLLACLHFYGINAHQQLASSVKWMQLLEANKQSPNFSVQHCAPRQVHEIAVN